MLSFVLLSTVTSLITFVRGLWFPQRSDGHWLLLRACYVSGDMLILRLHSLFNSHSYMDISTVMAGK